MNHCIFELKDLSFSYPNQKKILDIALFQIKPAEKVFLYGPSGCGKSTLLGLIAGVLSADQGSIKVFGHEFVHCPSSIRDQIRGEKMGYIFQMFNLIPYLTVFENVLLPCHLNKQRRAKFLNAQDLFAKAMSLCQKFKIDTVLNHKVTEISIGEQQRVATARALLGDPELIIADEPTSAMDADLQETFLENLLAQCERQNTALLFVSHDRRLAKIFHKEISLPDINRVLV